MKALQVQSQLRHEGVVNGGGSCIPEFVMGYPGVDMDCVLLLSSDDMYVFGW